MIRRRDPRAQILSRMEVLAGATSRELEKACGLMTEARLPAGRVLYAEGDAAQEVFLLVEGEVSVSRNAVAFGVVGPGSIIGELAVLEGQPRIATAVATTDVVALVMSPPEFAQLLEHVPSAATTVQALRLWRTEKVIALCAA